MTKEILSWLHEPVIVGEFGLHQTMEEIEFIAREMKLNEIQIPFCHPQKKELVFQKLNYSHNNPLQDHWKLADSPENYKWSSAKFYETGIDEFGFLTHYLDRK